MTSTNDGKDVKSIQTSGPKGKTYYIELYKSLEAGLSEGAEGSERTKYLCEAWRRVHSLCQHSAPSTHTHLLSWLQRHTARAVLQEKWQKPERKDDRQSLEEAIDAFIADCEHAKTARDGVSTPWEVQLEARGQWFKRVLEQPWDHPVLTLLLNPNGTPPTDDEVLKWLKEERGEMFVMRLRTLVDQRCYDIATLLASALMERVRAAMPPVSDAEEPKDKTPPENPGPTFGDRLKEEAGFTVDLWELLTDIEFVVLHKLDSKRCIALAKQTPLLSAYHLIERLQKRLEISPSEKKLWKNAKEVAILIAQVVIARCMMVASCCGAVRTALYCCARLLARLLGARLPGAADALATQAPTARHLHTLAQAVDKQLSQLNEMKPYVCELYVRAITAGMNELERFKLKTEKEAESLSMEKTLASWFVQLGDVLSQSNRVKCECTLTAFSLHPSQKMYELLDAAPQPAPVVADSDESKEETVQSEFGSWATDSRSQTNFVKTSETLNMKNSKNQANVLSTAIFNEGEALGLSPELCQDIAVLLSGPRVKTLSWDMDRTLLLENCRAYMERTHGGTRVLTRELKYLNIDPNQYQHLPEERDDDENDPYYGIERGYEHLAIPEFPEEIWNDANDPYRTETASSCMEDDYIVPRRKKKSKRVPLSSDEDSDPLSFMAEAKRVQKKKERPHSKERSKERAKKKLPVVDPLDIDGQNQTQKKEKPKEKKERKKKEKTPKVKAGKSLANLVGLKVAKTRKKPIKNSTAVITPVTDSDYDSQGKYSLASVNSEGNERDVPIDGLFCNDELNSCQHTLSHSVDNVVLMKKKDELRLASGKMEIKGSLQRFPNNLSRTAFRPPTPTAVRQQSPNNLCRTAFRPPTPTAVRQQSPSSQNRTLSPNIGTYTGEVRTSISKLLECRRQKAAMELKHNQNNTALTPQRRMTILRPDLPMQTNISPKAVVIPEIPKSYINKQHAEKLDELRKEVDNILAQRKKANPKNSVIQYADKNDANKATTSLDSQSGVQQRANPIKMPDLVNVPYDRLMAEIAERHDLGRGNYGNVKPHLQTQYQPAQSNVPLHKSLNFVTASQRDYQNFIKEYEQTKYCNTERALDMSSKMTPKDIRKDVRPMSRVAPVIPKAEPKPPQCAKQPTSQKKPENSLNTFSRLSYMHKNKQTEMKNKTLQEKPIFKPTIYQEVSSELDEIIKGHQREQLKVIQAKNARLLKNTPNSIDQQLPTNYDSSTQTCGHPVLSNLLQTPSPSSSSSSLCTDESQHKHNEMPQKPVSPRKTSLSEKDQNDLLYLLRQQSKLNAQRHLSTNMNSKPSTSTSSNAVTNNTLSVSNYNLMSCQKQQQLSKPVGYVNNYSSPHDTKIINIISNTLIKPPHNVADNYINTTSKSDIISATKSIKAIEPQDKANEATEHKGQTKNLVKCIPDAEKPEWQAVMSDLLRHRTPSRGPNALDVALKKNTFEQAFEKSLQNSTIFANRQSSTQFNIESIKQHGKTYLVNPATTVVQNIKLSSNKGEKTRTEVPKQQKTSCGLKKHSDLKKSDISLNEKCMKQNSPQIAKKLQQEVHRKQFTYAGPKHNDPFISGIPNSDYDLLEELMDDDLRKEIGELSSDDESYNAAAQSFLKPSKSNDKRVSVEFNKPLNDTAVKKPVNEVRCLNARQSPIDRQSQKPLIKCVNKMKQTGHGSNSVKVQKTSNSKTKADICSITATKSISANLPPTTTAQTLTYNNVETLTNDQVAIDHNIYISALPQQTPLQNVVLIGSELVYGGYSTFQTPVHSMNNLSPGTYVSVNNAPNINVYQTTQFTAPVVNPLIIASSTTVPIVNNVSCDKIPGQPSAFNNAAELSYPPTTIKSQTPVQELRVDIETCDASAPISNPVSASDCPLQNSKLLDLDKTIERKVLSEVQELAVTEKIDKARNQKIEYDMIIQKDSLADQERINKKRLAIINREIYHRCGEKTIPLTYSPLKTETVSKQHFSNAIPLTYTPLRPNEEEQNTSDCEEEKLLITQIKNNLQDLSDAINDVKSPATPDSNDSKENKSYSSIVCRRILLRSSNKICKSNTESVVSETTTNKKSILKLKSDIEAAFKMVDTSGQNNADVKQASVPKRPSKRIRSKTTKKVLKNQSQKQRHRTKLSPKNKANYLEDSTKKPVLCSDIDGIETFDFESKLLVSKISKQVPEKKEGKGKDLIVSLGHKLDTKIVLASEARNEIIPEVFIPQKTEDAMKRITDEKKYEFTVNVVANPANEKLGNITINTTDNAYDDDGIDKNIDELSENVFDKLPSNDFYEIVTPHNYKELKHLSDTKTFNLIQCVPETVSEDVQNTFEVLSTKDVVEQPTEKDAAIEVRVNIAAELNDHNMRNLSEKENVDLDMTVTCEEVNVSKITSVFANIISPRIKNINTEKIYNEKTNDDSKINKSKASMSSDTQTSEVTEDDIEQIDVEPVPASWKVTYKNDNMTQKSVKSYEVPCKTQIVSSTITHTTTNADDNIVILEDVLNSNPASPEQERGIDESHKEINMEITPHNDINDPSDTTKMFKDDIDLKHLLCDEELCETPSVPSTIINTTANDDDDIVIIDDNLNSTPVAPILERGIDESQKEVNADFTPHNDINDPSDTTESFKGDIDLEHLLCDEVLSETPPVSSITTIANVNDDVIIDENLNSTPLAPILEPHIDEINKEIKAHNDIDYPSDIPESFNDCIDLDHSPSIQEPCETPSVPSTDTNDTVNADDDIVIIDDDSISIPAAPILKRGIDESQQEMNMEMTPRKDVNDMSDIPQSFKDSIRIEKLPSDDPLKKSVRVTLPNGRKFKATVYGEVHVTFDTLFTYPTIKSALVNGLNCKKLYTMNIKQITTVAKSDPSKILSAQIQDMVSETSTEPVETIDLLSDDDDDCPPQGIEADTQAFETEYGKFKILPIDKDIFTKHQRNFRRKSLILLKKVDSKPEINIKMRNSGKTSQCSTLPAIPDKFITGLISDIENKLTSVTKNTSVADTEIVEIDDSSNDSLDCGISIENMQPDDKINELKNVLLKELGVEEKVQMSENILLKNLHETNKTHVVHETDFTKDNCRPSVVPKLTIVSTNESPSDELEKEEQLKIINRKCFIKLIRCDYLVKRKRKDSEENQDIEKNIFEKVSHDEPLTIIEDFSILNDLDKNIIESEARSSSPVIEFSDLLVTLDDNILVNSESTLHETISLSCEADWFTTKPTLHLQSVTDIFDQNKKQHQKGISKFCALEMSTEAMIPHNNPPNLMAIVLKCFQDINSVHQYRLFTVTHSPVGSLKRKSSSLSTPTSSKVSKLDCHTVEPKRIDCRFSSTVTINSSVTDTTNCSLSIIEEEKISSDVKVSPSDKSIATTKSLNETNGIDIDEVTTPTCTTKCGDRHRLNDRNNDEEQVLKTECFESNDDIKVSLIDSSYDHHSVAYDMEPVNIISESDLKHIGNMNKDCSTSQTSETTNTSAETDKTYIDSVCEGRSPSPTIEVAHIQADDDIKCNNHSPIPSPKVEITEILLEECKELDNSHDCRIRSPTVDMDKMPSASNITDSGNVFSTRSLEMETIHTEMTDEKHFDIANIIYASPEAKETANTSLESDLTDLSCTDDVSTQFEAMKGNKHNCMDDCDDIEIRLARIVGDSLTDVNIDNQSQRNDFLSKASGEMIIEENIENRTTAIFNIDKKSLVNCDDTMTSEFSVSHRKQSIVPKKTQDNDILLDEISPAKRLIYTDHEYATSLSVTSLPDIFNESSEEKHIHSYGSIHDEVFVSDDESANELTGEIIEMHSDEIIDDISFLNIPTTIDNIKDTCDYVTVIKNPSTLTTDDDFSYQVGGHDYKSKHLEVNELKIEDKNNEFTENSVEKCNVTFVNFDDIYIENATLTEGEPFQALEEKIIKRCNNDEKKTGHLTNLIEEPSTTVDDNCSSQVEYVDKIENLEMIVLENENNKRSTESAVQKYDVSSGDPKGIVKIHSDEIEDDIAFDNIRTKIDSYENKTRDSPVLCGKTSATTNDDCSNQVKNIDNKLKKEKKNAIPTEGYIDKCDVPIENVDNKEKTSVNEVSAETILSKYQTFIGNDSQILDGVVEHEDSEAGTCYVIPIIKKSSDTDVVSNEKTEELVTRISSNNIEKVSENNQINISSSHEMRPLSMEVNEHNIFKEFDDIEVKLAKIVGEPFMNVDKEKAQRNYSYKIQNTGKKTIILDEKYKTYGLEVEVISEPESYSEDVACQVRGMNDCVTIGNANQKSSNAESIVDRNNGKYISNFSSKTRSEVLENTQHVNNDRKTENLKVMMPKHTYARDTEHIKLRKNLKRKMEMLDVKTNKHKYRKGKNIDYPKITAAAISETGYEKEYKRLFDYCSSIKFSYSVPFHKEDIDVHNTLKTWPIENSYPVTADDQIEAKGTLFTELENSEALFNPMEQTLCDEIHSEYHENSYKPSNIDETNFNMGFGEGSGRVIKELKDGEHITFSAATLSDVKQLQPLLPSDEQGLLKHPNSNENQGQRLKSMHFFDHLHLKEKVKSYFRKTTAELTMDWVINSKKDDFENTNTVANWPFSLASPSFVQPFPVEIIANVVQVGQLPVSAGAQNPVTCDPRVTHVSNVSPSQCSPENNSGDDLQTPIKTEYTELTTADITLPLMQEYAQHHHSIPTESHETTNLYSANDTTSMATEIKSVVKIELIEETSQEKIDENVSYENNGLQQLPNGNVNNNVLCQFNNITNNMSTEPDSNPQTQVVANSSKKPKIATSFSEDNQRRNTSSKCDQIAHAMNAAGITATQGMAEANTSLGDTILQNSPPVDAITTSHANTSHYAKSTPINAIALQQALAQILPPPLSQTNISENNQQTSTNPQVLHIVQGNNSQSVINKPNGTQILHIVQNKTAATPNGAPASQNNFSGLSLVDGAIQQNGNQLLHIMNTGNQKSSNAGQLLKRVNLLTNLTNVQGSNEQKMVQFVCKSADGKSIQLPHQRSMVLRLQPFDPSNVPAAPKQNEAQDLSLSSNTIHSVNDKEPTPQDMKSRSLYEENYAKFVQNGDSKPDQEKATSLPKFNQVFGKQIYQDNQNDMDNENLPENSECPPEQNNIPLEEITNISSPPMLVRKPQTPTSQAQPNLVQQIKQTIGPMNIQTMHGGVIYTRQIPVNIGGGQTINLITVPSTELVDDSAQKQQADKFGNQEADPPLIKIVHTNQPAANPNGSTEDNNAHMKPNEPNPQPNPQPQPVLTQMRIKLPMLSKAPQMIGGTRVVRPSFFQIQRNVIGGANQQVYQQLVLTAAPPLGQSIRLPAPAQKPKTPADTQSSPESQMSTSTLEQLREFDMVLEQVKERSTVQPGSSSSNNFTKSKTSADTTDAPTPSTSTQESPTPVLYSVGNTQPLNIVNYVSRKSTITPTTTSSFVRSPDSTAIIDSPSSSTHTPLPHTVTSDSCASSSCASEAVATNVQPKPKKKKPKPSTSNSNPFNIKNIPRPSSQKPFEDEQTTQRILYILAEYKEQVENSPDKDKPAPRRRNNPAAPNAGSSKRKKSSSGSRRRDMSPVVGEDSCRTMGSEDSSCGTSMGECNECSESHSPEESPRKVVRRLTFEQETHITQTRTVPQRNVIVTDGQAFAVRGPTGKPATTVLMPANYILPVSMVKGGQQIAIVTNRGPKLLVGAGEGGTGGTLLFQRLIGPGMKPVLTRPGVRHIRLPTAALQNLQAFNIATPATTVQPPDSTASPAPAPTPPDLIDTRAMSSPWPDRDPGEVKPDGGNSSPEGSEPWNLPSSSIADDYGYEEIVRTDNMERTVLDAIPDRYSPDMEAQRIFDKMFDVDSKKSMYDSRCGYDIDASDDDKAYHQVVQRKDGRQTRLTHVSAAALRHKYAILEHELRLQKSLSEECEDLGVDSPSASELFPEAELLFAPSPAHEQTIEQCHTPQPTILQGIPQPDLDDQIATDHLLTHDRHDDLNINLDDVGEIVTVGEDGMTTIPLDHEEFARSHEEFARSHPNTTFHSEPEDGEIPPFTIAQGIKGRQITFHARPPGTVVMAPQTTVISQATVEAAGTQNAVKFTDIDNMINAMPSPQHSHNIPSVLVKDSNDSLTKFDRLLNESREVNLSNPASAVVHSSGNGTQVIRRVHYETRRDSRYLIEDPDALISGEAKMTDDRRDMESLGDDTSPERHPESFWESSTPVRPERRRFDFSNEGDKCCESPYEESKLDTNSIGANTRLDSVIKAARTERRRSDGFSDDNHPPLRTYPPKRTHQHTHHSHHHTDVDRNLSGKSRDRCHEGKDESRRRASNRGAVKRGCHCCNGSTAPPKPKKSRPKKTSDFPSHN